MPKIFLAGGVEFWSELGESILSAAKRAHIAIEHSCKNGRCGACLAPVLSGDTDVLQKEEFLGSEDFSGNHILTCCRTAKSDLVLDIHDLGEIGSIPTLTLPCRIDLIDRLSDNVVNLTLRLPPDSGFLFVAGQYVNLIHQDIQRSYSISNALRPDGKVELLIKKAPGGAMSEYLFSRASVNDLLRLEGPLGTFSYREDNSENLVFIATGTGIAPIKAMLESFEASRVKANVFVIWGARFEKDLFFELAIPSLPYSFIPVLSREDREGYFSGYVQDVVLDLGLDLKKTTVYACGSEVMIRGASELLIDSGLPSERFYSDAFVSSS